MTVVPFPKAPKPRPLPDAVCLTAGGDSVVTIEPLEDGWAVTEVGGNGAMDLGSRLSKEEAIEIGLSWVRCFNSELFLRNKSDGVLP